MKSIDDMVSDWHELTMVECITSIRLLEDRIKAAVAAAIPTESTDYPEGTFETVEPQDIKTGDIIGGHGYIGKVHSVKNFGGCYVFKCDFVAGDHNTFSWMREPICNGCLTGHRSHEQGNHLKIWKRFIPA